MSSWLNIHRHTIKYIHFKFTRYNATFFFLLWFCPWGASLCSSLVWAELCNTLGQRYTVKGHNWKPIWQKPLQLPSTFPGSWRMLEQRQSKQHKKLTCWKWWIWPHWNCLGASGRRRLARSRLQPAGQCSPEPERKQALSPCHTAGWCVLTPESLVYVGQAVPGPTTHYKSQPALLYTGRSEHAAVVVWTISWHCYLAEWLWKPSEPPLSFPKYKTGRDRRQCQKPYDVTGTTRK